MKKLLETKRLYLREFIPSDAEYIFRLHNDVDVMKYISSKKDKGFTMQECESFIEKCMLGYQKHPGIGIWATITKETNEFIGWTTLKHLDKTVDMEIGYRYFKSFWGLGYATEAARALVDYGFDVLNLNKITAIAMIENRASIRVIKKLGMVYKGIENYYNVDVAYYEILKNHSK